MGEGRTSDKPQLGQLLQLQSCFPKPRTREATTAPPPRQPQSSRQSACFPETELQRHPPAEILAGPQIPLPSPFPSSPANQRPENEQGLLSILAGQTSLFAGHIN